MASTPLDRLARLLVRHSVGVQPGEKVLLLGAPVARPLLRKVRRRIVAAGGEALIFGANLDDAPVTLFPDAATLSQANACIFIEPSVPLPTADTRLPDPLARQRVLELFLTRTSERSLRWVVSIYPCKLDAQRLGMTLADWQAFVFAACRVDRPHARQAWLRTRAAQQRLCDHLQGTRELHFATPQGTDLRVQVAGRRWINSDGQRNIPDGEVFSAPLQEGVDGVVHFVTESEFAGRVLKRVRLRFRHGEVVDASADEGQPLLERLLSTDVGARRVGEIALGCNYDIARPLGHVLFDEKVGGTFHLALGSAYPETGGTNQSLLHWDLVCDLRQGGRVTADAEIISESGRFTHADWPTGE